MSAAASSEHRKLTQRVKGKGRSNYGAPLATIRQICAYCMAESAQQIRLCPALECDLWAYRFGKRPATAAQHGEMVDVERAAELGWVEQAEAIWQDMKAARKRRAG